MAPSLTCDGAAFRFILRMSAILCALIPDIALSTARVGTVSLLANQQFSIQISVVVPQFCAEKQIFYFF